MKKSSKQLETPFSIFQLQQLNDQLIYKNQLITMKFINSTSDIPNYTEHIQNIKKLDDKMTHYLEDIAFGNNLKLPLHYQQIQNKTNLNIQYPIISKKQTKIFVQPEELQPYKKKCTCKKTGCLKMYCQCFAAGSICTDSCSCCNCENQQENKINLQKVQESIRSKNNKNKFNPTGNYQRRCTCKKSQCQKKYCQCYNQGQACGKWCKCQDCLNKQSVQMNNKKYLQKKLTS